MYQNETCFWDANRGCASNNLWGQFTPEGLWTEYTTDGGVTWHGQGQRWNFSQGYDVATVNNWGLTGGTSGVAYAYSCAKVGTTDLTAPVFSHETAITSPTTLGPYVMSVDMLENAGIDPAGVAMNLNFRSVDGDTDRVFSADSAHYTDLTTHSGTYYFTIPATHHNGAAIVHGDSIRIYFDGTDDYLNYGSTDYSWLIAGVSYSDVPELPPLQPNTFVLHNNYPNPFNPNTTIAFDLPRNAQVSLKVFNTMGQEVATLIGGQIMLEGRHSVNFDASHLASGVYFYTLRAGSSLATKKMVLMK